MKLYHPDAQFPIDCNPSRVAHMKARGWTEKPGDAKPKTVDKLNTRKHQAREDK